MGYESEATQFLKKMLAEQPELADLRARNRATWWDKPQDLEQRSELEAAKVAQPSYVYFPLPRPQGGNKPSTPSSPDTSKA